MAYLYVKSCSATKLPGFLPLLSFLSMDIGRTGPDLRVLAEGEGRYKVCENRCKVGLFNSGHAITTSWS